VSCTGFSDVRVVGGVDSQEFLDGQAKSRREYIFKLNPEEFNVHFYVWHWFRSWGVVQQSRVGIRFPACHWLRERGQRFGRSGTLLHASVPARRRRALVPVFSVLSLVFLAGEHLGAGTPVAN